MLHRTILVLALFTLGCSASDDSGGGGAPGSGGVAGASAGGSAGAYVGGAAGSIATGGTAGVASGGAAGASLGGTGGGSAGSAALPTLGSLVILGDSISDGGGQGPFYYNLLKNDLTAKYGNVAYQHKAQSGSKTGALMGQINDLPNTLPGPVAVCITSGGNDFKDVILQVVTGTDGPARAQMGQNISNALATLLAPDHFGAGVAVHVFEANIYDSSDGQGNFAANNCAFGGGYPAIPTDAYFASWNGEIATQVTQKGQWLADIHDLFHLHGFNYPPSWYAGDCTHPNTMGHDQLRRYFYFKITGETLP
jgi:hypothetical protein